MADPINPYAAWPADNMFPDDIDYNAGQIATVGTNVSSTMSDVATKWSGLSKGYHAPEDKVLFGAMKPANTLGSKFASDLSKAATALEVFANDVRDIQAAVAKIRTDAYNFLGTIHNGKVTVHTSVANKVTDVLSFHLPSGTKEVDWQSDQSTVDANNALIKRVNAQQEQLSAAERKCANAIRDLYGAPHIYAASASNPHGYGLDNIPDNAPMPWGSAVSRNEGCGEKVGKSVLNGGGDFLGGMGKGLSGLVGVQWQGWHPSWSASDLGGTWKNLGNLAVGLTVGAAPGATLLPGPVGNYLRSSNKLADQAVAGLVGIDPFSKDPFQKWKQDPVRTLTSSILNVGSFFIPGGGEANAGAKGASAAEKASEIAGDTGKTAEIAGDAGKAGDASYLSELGQGGKVSSADLVKLDKEATDLHADANAGGTDINIPHENVNVEHPNTGDHTPADAPGARDPGQPDTSGTGPGHSGYGADGKWHYAQKADPSWSSVEKGAYGEKATDEFMTSNGTTRLDIPHSSVTSNGIDGIYRASDGHVIIVESKFGTAALGKTADGVRQMSDNWLLGSARGGASRIDVAVGDNPALAREITNAVANGDASKLLVHTSPSGVVTAKVLNSDGYVIRGAIPKF